MNTRRKKEKIKSVVVVEEKKEKERKNTFCLPRIGDKERGMVVLHGGK